MVESRKIESRRPSGLLHGDKIERKTEYNDGKGMKEESGGKKFDQF